MKFKVGDRVIYLGGDAAVSNALTKGATGKVEDRSPYSGRVHIHFEAAGYFQHVDSAALALDPVYDSSLMRVLKEE